MANTGGMKRAYVLKDAVNSYELYGKENYTFDDYYQGEVITPIVYADAINKHQENNEKLKDSFKEQDKNTEEFNTKLKELNKKYGIKEELNSHIPEMFNLYNQEYYNFFGKTLPDINQYTYRYFLEVKGIG